MTRHPTGTINRLPTGGRGRELGLKDWVARQLRDRSGPRTAAAARALHTFSLYGLGHGTATLDVHRSGEHHAVALIADRRAPIVIDVGAYDGAYARMARSLLADTAIIHCFEPNPSSFARLQIHAGSLFVHEMALAAQSGTSTLHEDPGVPTMATLSPDALAVVGRAPTRQMTVDVSTLDEFCSERAIDRIDLLKLDVEGAELAVLQGAAELLDEGRIGIVQFEFGFAHVATRTFLREFFDLLGGTRDIYRVAPRGLVPLGDYRLELEVFTSVTNYVAAPR